tara:strand:- start:461 stop:2077 length:1617 start_codon:yes stop_codon:yes gene_type:complete
MQNNNNLNPLNVVDRKSFLSILILSILVSILSLIVPVAAQMLVNIVAFARIVQPIVVISVVVLAILVGTTILSIWQYIIVEILQQKLFARTVIESAKKIPILKPEIFFQYKGPEIVNHFFDVVTIQKTLAAVLIYGTNIIVSTFFGMILLAFYHPYFLWFDIVLILAVGLAILLPYRFALSMAHEECKQKHRIGFWLEEIIENSFLFKFNNNQEFALQETDERLVKYLQARNKHFAMILRHIGSIHIISALAICLLLGIGGYLVTINQLSLGQLVAAEIVLSGITVSLKQFSLLMKDYYDMLASNVKVQQLLNLDSEPTRNGDLEHDFQLPDEINLQFKDFSLEKDSKQKLNITIGSDKALIFQSEEIELARTLMDLLSGFPVQFKGQVLVNEIPTDYSKWLGVRDEISRLNRLEIFKGSISDNILLGHKKDATGIMKLLTLLGLQEKIVNLPNGLETIISKNEAHFSLTELKLIMIARIIVANPKIIMIDAFLDNFSAEQCELVKKAIDQYTKAIIIIFSRQKKYVELFSQTEEKQS